MSGDESGSARALRVRAALTAGDGPPDRTLCTASAGIVGVTRAGVVLMSRGRPLGTLCSSDAVTQVVEDVQYTLGEGPCVDAFAFQESVLAPDLAGGDFDRWPDFCEGALAAGVQAAFGFPVLVGPVGIGALNLYNDDPGPLSEQQVLDAVAVARQIGRTLLSWQSTAAPGSLPWQLEALPMHRAALHQAAGMVSVQAAVPVDDALALLRAYAFAEGHPITEVATDVVDGRLRFDDA